MKTKSFFHHPDVSFTVIRRRLSENFLDMLQWYGEVLLTSGRRVLWGDCFPSETAYRCAVRRLSKSGVIAGRPDIGTGRILEVSDARIEQTARFMKPDKFWKTRWNGSWHVLVYDIPEKEAYIRRSLRQFMRNLHMGCLQRSVWVTPTDIRPDYDDLVQTIAIEFESYLFEATTVLGRSQQDIVLNAWDFNRLSEKQSWYCKVCRHNLAAISSTPLSRQNYERIANEEMDAYYAAMIDDPLLPNELLPHGYFGQQVFTLHKKFVNVLKTCLKNNA